MPFEVFSPFFRCRDDSDHDKHFKLSDAAACFDEIRKNNDGNIPVHPISGKYIHAIVAVDKNGNQRDFTKREKRRVKRMGLDPRSIHTEKPGVTTFGDVARKYHEAMRLVPISAVDLAGTFDFSNLDRRQHFWNTDAGVGQVLAYTQQALFTLELSMKAVLEVLGKLTKTTSGARPDWQTHDLVVLFGMLDNGDRQELEQRWASLSKSERHFDGTLAELLDSVRDSYEKWRYIPQLKDAPSMNTGALISASGVLLNYADSSFRQNLPISFKSTIETFPNTHADTGNARTMNTTIVEGVVRSVRVPDGYDPHATVEVVIDSDHHEQGITAEFYRRNVEDYYSIKGERVVLGGTSYGDEPHVLYSPQHIGETWKSSASYSSERRTLKGTVYKIWPSETAYGIPKTNLILKDDTFFSEVDCLFVANEELARLEGVGLGDEILISGHVTSLSGRPISLVGADEIKQVEEPSES